MKADTADQSLIEEILSGDHRNLELLAADGLLPLALSALVPLLVTLSQLDDEAVSLRALRTLLKLDPGIVAPVLAEEKRPDVLAFYGVEHPRPLLQEVILRRRDAPRELLRQMAPLLDPDLQEILVLRQDAFADDPAILDALESNPRLSSDVRRRIGEYRAHPPDVAADDGEPVAGVEEELEEARDLLEEAAAAFAIAFDAVTEGEPAAEEERIRALSEVELRSLPVAVRLRLCRGAGPRLRSILIRDPNPRVALCLLEQGALSEAEIEQVATSRLVVSEVLEAIGKDRRWLRKYTILLALTSNPRTPVGLAVRLVGSLAARDLLAVSRDRNVAEAVRSVAARLYRIKTG